MGDDGLLHVRERVFTDIVMSSDPRLTGTNRVTVALDLDPETGQGELTGSFHFTPESGNGAWEGQLVGTLNGMVSANGLARGVGSLEGAVLHLAFQQVGDHPDGQPACDEPLAFYEMTAFVLDRG